MAPGEAPPLRSAIATGLCAGLSLAGWILGPGAGSLVLYALSYAAGGTMAALTAVAELKRRRLSVDLLMILAAAGAAVLGDWGEGAVLLFLFSLSGTLEAYAMYRTTRSIDALIKLRPREASLIRDGEEARVPIEALKIGDIIRVRPGERFPVDGEVIEGETWADESTLTGESEPVGKAVGDPVFAGTINGRGSVLIRMTRAVADTTLERIVRLVRDAQAEKTAAQLLRRVVARPIRRGGAVRLRVRLRRLLVPAPAGVRRLVLPRDGDPGRLLAVRRGRRRPGGTALGDRPGGAARGAVQGGAAPGDAGEGRRHRLRQDRHDHPGQAGRDHRLGGRRTRPGPAAGPGRGGRAAERASPGRGGRRRGGPPRPGPERGRRLRDPHRRRGACPCRWPLGRHRPRGALRLARASPYPPPSPPSAQRLREQGQTALLILLAGDGPPTGGVIAVADHPRPDAAAALASLKRSGVATILILTGDHERSGTGRGAQVGADDVRSGLLPDEKVLELRRLMNAGHRLAMVGDGVNDAPALATAHVGIAMGGAGTDVALEVADVVLIRDDLRALSFAVWLSRLARRRVRQNLAFAFAVIGVLVLSSFFGLPLWMGVVGHEGSTLLVVLNGLRLLWESPPSEGSASEPGGMSDRGREPGDRRPSARRHGADAMAGRSAS